jgi:hypothetical protein
MSLSLKFGSGAEEVAEYAAVILSRSSERSKGAAKNFPSPPVILNAVKNLCLSPLRFFAPLRITKKSSE